jgi:hypothetical protein
LVKATALKKGGRGREIKTKTNTREEGKERIDTLKTRDEAPMGKKTRKKGRQKPPQQKKTQWFRNSNQKPRTTLANVYICHSVIVVIIRFLKQQQHCCEKWVSMKEILPHPKTCVSGINYCRQFSFKCYKTKTCLTLLH